MSELEELRRRVTALERQVSEQSALRVGMDEDLSSNSAKIRAMHHTTQALAITQGEHGEELRRIRSEQREFRSAVMDEFQKVNSGIVAIVALLDGRDGTE